MADFIKPLLGIIVIAVGVSITLLGIYVTAQMSLFGFISTIVLLFVGAGTCEIGYIIVTGGDLHESFLFKVFVNFSTKQ